MESKTIYLEKQETKTSQKFTIQASELDKFIDISSIITRVPEWEEKYFQIYSPQQDQYISLDSICEKRFMIPREYLQLNLCMIKYSNEPEKEQSSPSEENKKERSRERSVRQVIELVRKWREMHNSNPETKRLNLQEAAKIVGISKKSLDDYFFQLRMGEKYGFDFNKYMDAKVGVLRSFVKERENEQRKTGRQKMTRHPKKLRIIEEFDKKLHLRQKQEGSQNEEPNSPQKIEEKQKLENGFKLGKLVDTEQLFWGSPFSPIQEKAFLDCQNNFFKDFQNLMDQPNDPFLPFANFKKSKSIFGDDQNSFSPNLDF